MAALEVLQVVAVVCAVLYLVLVIRENTWCWPVALIGSLLSLVVVFDRKLYMDAALHLFYAAMAIYGWLQWVRGGERSSGVAICVWSWRRHAVAIAGILVGTVAFGALLEARTDAALPYLDSFTTIAALVTTYMVAKKVLENWIYWFVIDGISVYLYVARELFWFAGLFVGYLVLIVIGFRAWSREWRTSRIEAAAGSGAY
ncbi:MAG: nicotinamide riboside transporter PnuC [Gammaproteobacteria bacterium]|nr:nicotinamide mononucleotide transporter [Gammaproteobacteria bacterium]